MIGPKVRRWEYACPDCGCVWERIDTHNKAANCIRCGEFVGEAGHSEPAGASA